MNLYRSETFTCQSKGIMHQKLSLMFKMMMQKSVCVYCRNELNFLVEPCSAVSVQKTLIGGGVSKFIIHSTIVTKATCRPLLTQVTARTGNQMNSKFNTISVFCTVASHWPHSHPYRCSRKNKSNGREPMKWLGKISFWSKHQMNPTKVDWFDLFFVVKF